MNNMYVADTMAIVLYLENRKLPQQVKDMFAQAIGKHITINFSAISLMEIGYLSERRRIDISLDDVLAFVANNENFRIADLDAETIQIAFKVDDIPELHDRLIAA